MSRFPKAPPVERSPTGLQYALETYTVPGTRKEFERHNVHFQCETVLGPFERGKTCWLCGFPIGEFARYIERGVPWVSMANPMLDRATCEHVLPVKLGHAVTELLYLARDPISEELLHTEYEYAHNHCNYIKNDEYFATLPLEATDFCSIKINEEKVDKIIDKIFHNARRGATQSSILYITYKGKKIQFENPVQAYCFTSNPERYLADPEAFYQEVWKPFAKKLILAKMARVIQYVKKADFCDEAEGVANAKRGIHFAGVKERLKKALPPLPKPKYNSDSNSNTARKKVWPGRVLARKPSINNILQNLKNARVLPFQSANNFQNVPNEVNNSNTNNNSSASRASPLTSDPGTAASQAVSVNERANVISALAEELASNDEVEASEEREEEVAAAAAPAAPAPAPAPLVPIAAVPAAALGKPRLRRQLGTRKLVNANNNSNESSNENTMAARRRRGALRRTAKAAAGNSSLPNGLRMEIGPRGGIYLSGNTYRFKNTIKAKGGIWNRNKKQWILKPGTNLSNLV